MEDLLRDLGSPIKTFRLFALEKAIQEGATPEALAVLKEHQRQENDEECQILLQHAIAAVHARVHPPESALATDETPETWEREWPVDSPEHQVALLAGLSSAQVRELAVRAPIWLAATDVPAVQATLLRTFRRNWPADQLADLSRYLGGGSSAVRSAALEILIEMAPLELVRFLPKLLGVDDPRLRSLAVQGLVAIDLDGALEHIEAMLLSAQPAMRGFALRNCLFLPFDRVKGLILKSMAVETFPELLEKAGAILCSNPDPEVPFHLWEIVELAPAKLQAPLKGILQGVCLGLRDGRVLGDDFPAYQEQLEEWVRRRVAVRQVQTWLETLGEGADPAPAPDPAQPTIRWALEQALTWDIPESRKIRIRELMMPPTLPVGLTPTMGDLEGAQGGNPPQPSQSPNGEPPAGPSVAAVTTPPPGEPGSRGSRGGAGALLSSGPPSPAEPEKSVLMQLNQWPDHDPEGALRFVGEVLAGSDLDPATTAAALRVALRFRLMVFTGPAERGLKSPHDGLVVAALEYLGLAEPDRLLPYLGRFLQSRSRRIKIAALDQVRQLDPPRALSAVEFMLSNKDQGEQEQALACLIHFEFSVVRRLLISFLKSHPPEPLFLKCLCLFQANPDKENLFPLYCLEKSLFSPIDAKVRKVREVTVQALLDQGFPVDPALTNETRLEEKRLQEEERQRKPSPYSVSQVKPQDPGKPMLERILEAFGLGEGLRITGVEMGMAGVAVVLALVGWLALRWAEPAPETPASMRPGAVLAERLEVTGRIIRVPQELGLAFEMQGQDGLLFAVDSSSGLPPISPGDSVQATLLPVRIARNGTVIAHCLALQKLPPDGTLPKRK